VLEEAAAREVNRAFSHMTADDAKKAGYREAKTEASTKAKSKTADTKQK